MDFSHIFPLSPQYHPPGNVICVDGRYRCETEAGNLFFIINTLSWVAAAVDNRSRRQFFYTWLITFRTLFLFQGSDCTLHGLKIQHRPNLHYIIPSSFIKRYHSRQSPPKAKLTPIHFHQIRQNPCFVSRTGLSYPCNIIGQSTTELL